MKTRELAPSEFMQTNEYHIRLNELRKNTNKDCYKPNGRIFEKTNSEKMEVKLAKHIHHSEMLALGVSPKKQMNVRIDDILRQQLSKKFKIK